MGAYTVTKVKELGHFPWAAGKRAKLVKITGPASYDTGGSAVVPLVDFGLRRVDLILPISGAVPNTYFQTGALAAPSTGGYRYSLTGTALAPTITVTKGAGSPAEETAATNLSAQSFYAIVVGDGA
jgi:hypothetical protein